MKIGYARVSTSDQNPALQLAALKRERCRRIFTDKVSGALRKRPELDKCLAIPLACACDDQLHDP